MRKMWYIYCDEYIYKGNLNGPTSLVLSLNVSYPPSELKLTNPADIRYDLLKSDEFSKHHLASHFIETIHFTTLQDY